VSVQPPAPGKIDNANFLARAPVSPKIDNIRRAKPSKAAVKEWWWGTVAADFFRKNTLPVEIVAVA